VTAVRARLEDLREVITADWYVTAVTLLLSASLFVTAYVFPNSREAGLASLILVAAGGAAVAWVLETRPVRSMPEWVGAALAYAVILAMAHDIFSNPWHHANILKWHDWGTHHAITRELVDGLRAGHVPMWVQGLTTGEPVFDLYPSLPYYLAAGVAYLWHATDQLPMVLTRLAMVVHVAVALATVRLALRLVSWPLAAAAGLMILFDRGAGGVTGGWNGLLFWGVFHQAVANCFWLLALASLLDALRRPRLGTTILFWVLATLGVLSHPMGVLVGLATVVALLTAAAFASDLPRRRALVGAFHVTLVLAVTAHIWMPLFSRLLEYGVHYGHPPHSIWSFFDLLISGFKPFSQLAVATSLGMIGVFVAATTRRAAPTVVGVLAGIFIVGCTDQLYLLLFTGPTPEIARFSPQRLLAMAKAPIFICGVYLFATAVKHTFALWKGRWRLVVGAFVALTAFWLVRGVRPFVDTQRKQMRENAEHAVSPADMKPLIKWARAREKELRPDAFARLLIEEPKHSLYHVKAESDLPTASLGCVANLFLRDRIESSSPESLRRFNVRWVIKSGGSPAHGDPATEQTFGSWHIREVKGWDGKFARVERGRGEAVVTRLDDERVDVELRDTDKPALVALGTGYYPRWRARYEDGRSLPVYAMPATKNGKHHVVAAWIPPGKTTFVPTGSLPSDGRGVFYSVLAGMLMIGITAVWSRRRWRLLTLRRMALWSRWVRERWRARRRLVGLVAAGLFAVVLLALAVRSTSRPTDAFRVGVGLQGNATVEARKPKGAWHECEYSPIHAIYRCLDVLHVRDVVVALLNDAPHDQSWPFSTQTINLFTRWGNAEFRIRLKAKLEGTYWARTDGGVVTVETPDGKKHKISRQQTLTFEPAQSGVVTLSGEVKKGLLKITFVRTSTLASAELKHYPTPPEEPPPEVFGRSDR